MYTIKEASGSFLVKFLWCRNPFQLSLSHTLTDPSLLRDYFAPGVSCLSEGMQKKKKTNRPEKKELKNRQKREEHKEG